MQQSHSRAVICPNCGFINSSTDAKCANCYHTLIEETVSKRARGLAFKFTFQGIALACLPIAALGYFIFGGGNWNTPNEPLPVQDDGSWRKDDHSGSAYIMMNAFVRDKCFAPGTTIFPDRKDKGVEITRPDDHTYRITGYVDSMNSAGSISRTYYSGEISEPRFAQWKLISLAMGDAGEVVSESAKRTYE